MMVDKKLEMDRIEAKIKDEFAVRRLDEMIWMTMMMMRSC